MGPARASIVSILFAALALGFLITNHPDPSFAQMLPSGPEDTRGCDGEMGSGKMMLACGCDNATSCLDCNGVPNGPGKELACGCDTPAGDCGCAPCSQCVYSFNIVRTGFVGNLNEVIYNTPSEAEFTGATTLSCLKTKIKQAQDACKNGIGTNNFRDDCVHLTLLGAKHNKHWSTTWQNTGLGDDDGTAGPDTSIAKDADGALGQHAICAKWEFHWSINGTPKTTNTCNPYPGTTPTPRPTLAPKQPPDPYAYAKEILRYCREIKIPDADCGVGTEVAQNKNPINDCLPPISAALCNAKKMAAKCSPLSLDACKELILPTYCKREGIPEASPPACVAPTNWARRCNRYNWCGDATVYFDSSCTPVPKPSGSTPICDSGSYKWKLSPISLLWRSGYDIRSSFSLANFPIEPGANRRTYRWYGSSEAPLLVWDPEHRGEVRDGTQIFGHWTFGGQRLAKLDNGAINKNDARWSTGYEALATLDSDADGAVSGAELKDLALWFDGDRDGVSQAGEVRQLSEVGVTKLFYTPSRTDDKGDIFASRGFERTVNGETEMGGSVDWFAEGEPNTFSLVNKLVNLPRLCTDGTGSDSNLAGLAVAAGRRARETSVAPIVSPNNDVNYTSINRGAIAGIWEWRIKGDAASSSSEPPGYLTFTEEDDGGIRGHSYAETLLKNGESAYSSLSIATLRGKRTIDGYFIFRMDLTTAGGVTLESSAQVVGQDKIEGTTIVSQIENGKPVTFSYDWVANRQ